MIGQPPPRALRAHSPAPGDRVLGALWYLVVVAALAGLLWSLWILAIPIALGYLASILLAPAVDSLYRRGLPRAGAALAVTGALLVVIAIAVWQTAPLVLRQYEAFHANLPVYQQQINAQLEGLFRLLGHLVPSTELIHTRDALYAKLKSGGSPFRSLEELFAVLPLVENVLLALVVSFFLLATGMEMRQAVVSMVPNRYFEMVLRLMYRIQQQTSNYIRGQSMDCAINAVLISSTLWVLGIPYSGLIGLLAGLANAIPFVGPIAGGVPAVVICLLDPQSLTPLWHTVGLTFLPAPSWWFAAACLFGIHMIDANFIYPYTVGRSLRINALVVILAIALGAHVGGIVGMLVIIPILGLLRGIIGELHTSLRGFNII